MLHLYHHHNLYKLNSNKVIPAIQLSVSDGVILTKSDKLKVNISDHCHCNFFTTLLVYYNSYMIFIQ